jgi:hypothetical protein
MTFQSFRHPQTVVSRVKVTPKKDLIARPDPTRPDLTVSHPRSSTTKPQEAKKEARIEREEFALTGGNKKLTKKERKRLEQAEFE